MWQKLYDIINSNDFKKEISNKSFGKLYRKNFECLISSKKQKDNDKCSSFKISISPTQQKLILQNLD